MLDKLMMIILNNINISRLFVPRDTQMALKNEGHPREGDRLILVT